ncbi:YebC/PmpR family DNA-binding transcriptional regulator, partial [Oceanibaculum nanhaiense]|uniref:YebC/PmpR family DNA-binding transcriptional regulator n=1 Tax=Oceanibaculum nanhaiense TaxID=1909734 RepID=UPI00396E13F1
RPVCCSAGARPGLPAAARRTSPPAHRARRRNPPASEETHEVTCSQEDFAAVRDALEEKFGAPQQAGLVWRPQNSTPVDEEKATSLLKLIDVLEDNDDVQSVAANFEIPDDVMEKLTAA